MQYFNPCVCVWCGEGGGRNTPSAFSRGGSLLPSVYADARYIDDGIVLKAQAFAGLDSDTTATKFVNSFVAENANYVVSPISGVAKLTINKKLPPKKDGADEEPPPNVEIDLDMPGLGLVVNGP